MKGFNIAPEHIEGIINQYESGNYKNRGISLEQFIQLYHAAIIEEFGYTYSGNTKEIVDGYKELQTEINKFNRKIDCFIEQIQQFK